MCLSVRIDAMHCFSGLLLSAMSMVASQNFDTSWNVRIRRSVRACVYVCGCVSVLYFFRPFGWFQWYNSVEHSARMVGYRQFFSARGRGFWTFRRSLPHRVSRLEQIKNHDDDDTATAASNDDNGTHWARVFRKFRESTWKRWSNMSNTSPDSEYCVHTCATQGRVKRLTLPQNRSK